MCKNPQLTFLIGILGPIFFGSLVLALGFLHPQYNHVVNLVSELGVTGSPFALLINFTGFILFGSLVVIFSINIHRLMAKSTGSVIGPISIAITGMGLIGLGLFPCDPACVNVTFSGFLHTIFNRLAIATAVIAPFLMAERFYHDRKWRNLSKFSISIGIISLFVWLIFFFTPISPFAGFVQKVGILIPLFWMEVVSYNMVKITIPKKYWPSWDAMFWEKSKKKSS